ncbi:T-complex 11 [Powellomyces hirtus]|nr:T-complex 11 [Powellomyces hirtus]
MDPEFKLTPVQRGDFEEQVRGIAKKAFFDSVRDEFNKGNFKSHVPTFIAQIRESLLSMVAEKGKFAEDIKEVLEMSHIQQQVDKNAFDVVKCMSYITSKMLQLCAPIRDGAIRSITQSTDLADAFQRTLAILDDMKLDLANYRLQALRPHLQQQAVEYERTKFDEALNAGIVTLNNTTSWLHAAAQSLASTAAARNPENIQSIDNRVRYESAYNEALIGLVQSSTPINPETIAETLMLDAHRLFSFQNEAQAITIVAALVMLSKNAIRELRDDATACTRLKDTLFILLKDKNTNLANLSTQIIATLNSHKQPSARLTPDQEQVIINMVGKTLSYKDPVFNLLSRRIAAAVRTHLEKGVFRKETLQSAGLDSVQNELEKLSFSIARLAKHNKEVYAKHYDAILTSALQQ